MEVVVGEFVILTCKLLSGAGKLTTKWVIDGREVESRQISPNILACHYITLKE